MVTLNLLGPFLGCMATLKNAHSCSWAYQKQLLPVYLYQQVKVKNEQGLGLTHPQGFESPNFFIPIGKVNVFQSSRVLVFSKNYQNTRTLEHQNTSPTLSSF